MPRSTWCIADGSDVLLRIKAVPGASRNQIAGLLGDRLKVRIAAAPAGGKANRAVCTLLARALGIKAASVTVECGRTSPEKLVRIAQSRCEEVAAVLEQESNAS